MGQCCNPKIPEEKEEALQGGPKHVLFAPRRDGMKELARDVLKADLKKCRRIGVCGLGDRAIYLATYFRDRSRYICYEDIARVYKRVAMSKGGFSGKGIFGSMAYLVVVLRDGSERVSRMKYEDQVDSFLAIFCQEHPDIPIYTVEGEKKIREAEEKERVRYLSELSPQAEEAVRQLQRAKDYLEKKPELSEGLTLSARRKRIVEGINPSYRALAIVIALLGLAALLFGIYAFVRGMGLAMYFLLFGFSAVFLVMSSQILPWGNMTRRGAEEVWETAKQTMADYLSGYDREFPLPASYAHPVTLERMIRVLREGRAVTAEQAYEQMKEDLKKLNADVKVSQKEYEEVVAIKSMFLLENYS